MPNELLEEAIREAYTTARSSAVMLDTLQISHPALEEDLFLVSHNLDLALTLETSEVKTFQATAFRITKPATGENGRQELGIVFDNVNKVVSEFVNQAKITPSPMEVWYRPYLLEDLSKPQLSAPLVLYITDVTMSLFNVTCRASFTDIINRPFPARAQNYSRRRFPSLGG